MRKHDKIIVVAGVVILILAAIGIYYWVPEAEAEVADFEDFFSVSGVLSNAPNAIIVPDSCPFYPLIATPLAVNYDNKGNQMIAPLYIENIEDTSTAVMNVRSMIGRTPDVNIELPNSPKEVSLDLAKEHWKSSEGALIIESTQEGYCLGVIATPIASYLCIPVIVTDEIDEEVTDVLNDLDVTHTIICGENLEGYGKYLRFDNVEDIVDAQIELVQEKFGMVDYITLTNPIDAWPPEVLDSFEENYGPITIPSGASTRIFQALTKSGAFELGRFTIPKDYKYALIKFEGVNLDSEDVDDFGDYVSFSIGADLPDIPAPLQAIEVFAGSTGAGGFAERDADGNLLKDKAYTESVVYDRGGTEYVIRTKGQWMLKKQGDVAGKVIVEKLENPVYTMMKQLSSLAPYLTAYHQGIVFGKPEFAFVADDDVIISEGTNAPGFWMPRRNPRIVDNANRHIFDTIHKPLNEILAKLANIEIEDDRDIKTLREYYVDSPVYIAIVGGATSVPNYIYQNYLEPVDYLNGQYSWGVGTPSDVIYGNIDPIEYDWSNLADDIYTDFPYQENIVGRITGYDAQDASALISRNLFYNEIIDDMDEWKDTYTVLIGDGLDFRQPWIRYPLANLFGSTHRGEPMKMWTGFAEIMLESVIEELAKPLGFTTVNSAFKEAAMKQGFSEEDINKLKFETGLMNKFTYFKPQLRRLIGDAYVKGGEMIENSNFILLNGHGNKNILAMDGIDLTVAGFGGPIAHFILKKVMEVVSPYTGPGASLSSHGSYTTREVATMDFGPSFMWLESCICGKIDGLYPTTNLGQAFLHAGIASMVASPTGSNIPGGYLEPKNRQQDGPFSVLRAYIVNKLNARKGIYPDPHFGFLIYSDMCHDLNDNDATIGMAFRNAKNAYLPQDASWKLWWSPPLVTTGNYQEDMKLQEEYSEKMKNQALEDPFMMKNKYTSFQEYMLFGDPAFNPYIPE